MEISRKLLRYKGEEDPYAEEIKFFSPEKNLLAFYRLPLGEDGSPDPELCSIGFACPPDAYEGRGLFGGSDVAKAYAADIRPLELLADKNTPVCSTLMTKIGYDPISSTPVIFINEDSPLPYRKIKEFLFEVDEEVRKMFPGYGVVYREGDPRDNEARDRFSRYTEKRCGDKN